MAQQGQLSCKSFTDFLIRKSEHLDDILIRDVTPTDGWIGHVSTGTFNAFDGVSHTFDRINRVFPDLSGCWQDVEVGNCLGTPCDPDEKIIGFGSTRDSYNLQTRSYATQLFCFDLIMSADRAKEQFGGIITNLKTATNIIMSDRLRTEALRTSGTKIAAGAAMEEFTFTTNADCTEIVPTALPTSKLTVQMLQRQLEPLKLNGYFGANPGMPMIAEVVTDMITGYNLVQGNTALASLFRFDDFAVGGNLYKYGMTNGVGNFGFRYDDFPLRYQLLADGVTLQRVFPYNNVDATQGIKGIVNPAYINARYQVDFIWNRMAMKTLVRDSKPINPMMPFAARDYAGKWQFVMDNLGADANGCVIENTRRNKGKFIADFANATQAVHPEWAIAILSLREPACVVDVETCNPDPGYVVQDYNSANDVCPNPDLTFDLSGLTAPFSIDANTITCNGVPIDHDASGDLADVAAVVTWLEANVAELGDFTQDGDNVVLADSTCNTVDLAIQGS